MLVDFKLLSDSSKLWVFQSDKIISPSNQKILINEISPFLTLQAPTSGGAGGGAALPTPAGR